MAGRGPAPKDASQRINHHAAQRGEWRPAVGLGWQHGETPAPPDGLKPASVEAWNTWMGSWVASFWAPDDVPGLRVMILVYDQVERGEYQRANELRLQMDNYGLTPKGKQDRRWAPPAAEGATVAQVRQVKARKLRAV